MKPQEFNTKFLHFHIRRILQSILVLCSIPIYICAQGEIDTEQKVLYRNELTGSIGLHSYGFACGARYAKHVYRLKKTVYDIQWISIHNPKEIKLSTPTGRMVYGKLNNAYALTFAIGTQTEKFSKLDKSSVAISFIYNTGIALGIEKPVYYYIKYPDVIERFNTSNHTKYGKAPFIYGIDEIRLIPGIFITSSAQFEFSKTDKDVKSLEFGAGIYAFARKLDIMYSNENNWLFPTLFINYRIGKVLKQ